MENNRGCLLDKVIDLLDEMASNKNYKPTFLFKNCIYKYNAETKYYEPSFMGLYKMYMILNDEIEIIEETPKKIEEIDLTIAYLNNTFQEQCLNDIVGIQNKINELVDKVNYLLEKSDSNDN